MQQGCLAKKIGVCWVLAVLSSVLLACGGAQLRGGAMPDWIVEGSGAFRDGGDQVFYGVGSVVGVGNAPLAWTSAENRARAEVGKVFETYTASLMKDYMASTTGAATVTVESPRAEEQHIEQSIKTFSQVTLSGVMIVDRWVDDDNETYYALARLDLEKFKDSLARARELNRGVVEYIRQNAERSFNDLAHEEAQRD